MGVFSAGLAFFAGLLLGTLFGWDVRTFLTKGAGDIRPEETPDIVPIDKEDRF